MIVCTDRWAYSCCASRYQKSSSFPPSKTYSIHSWLHSLSRALFLPSPPTLAVGNDMSLPWTDLLQLPSCVALSHHCLHGIYQVLKLFLSWIVYQPSPSLNGVVHSRALGSKSPACWGALGAEVVLNIYRLDRWVDRCMGDGQVGSCMDEWAGRRVGEMMGK